MTVVCQQRSSRLHVCQAEDAIAAMKLFQLHRKEWEAYLKNPKALRARVLRLKPRFAPERSAKSRAAPTPTPAPQPAASAPVAARAAPTPAPLRAMPHVLVCQSDLVRRSQQGVRSRLRRQRQRAASARTPPSSTAGAGITLNLAATAAADSPSSGDEDEGTVKAMEGLAARPEWWQLAVAETVFEYDVGE